jgi:POT family proton-dependent oligopeptide transporter
MPLLGAYMAEKYWGRFKTIQISIYIALVGHVILIMSAIPPVIVHPDGAIAAFAIGLIIMGVGVGGFKSNISVLISEQCMKYITDEGVMLTYVKVLKRKCESRLPRRERG